VLIAIKDFIFRSVGRTCVGDANGILSNGGVRCHIICTVSVIELLLMAWTKVYNLLQQFCVNSAKAEGTLIICKRRVICSLSLLKTLPNPFLNLKTSSTGLNYPLFTGR